MGTAIITMIAFLFCGAVIVGEFACGKWKGGKRKKERAPGSCLSPLFLPSSNTTTTCYNAWSHDEINLSRPQTRLKVYPPTYIPMCDSGDLHYKRIEKEIRSLGPAGMLTCTRLANFVVTLQSRALAGISWLAKQSPLHQTR